MLTSLYTKESIPDFPLPDFSCWDFWEDGPPSERLDKDLSAFLQHLFTEFYNSVSLRSNRDDPTTISSLITECLTLLDDRPELPKFHSALRFFVVVLWRSNPDVFDAEPSVAHGLLTSAAKYSEDVPSHATAQTVRLLAIAYGPKHLVSRQSIPLETIRDLYACLHNSVKMDPERLKGLIHANAATLETLLSTDGHSGARIPRLDPGHGDGRDVIPSLLVTDDTAFKFSASVRAIGCHGSTRSLLHSHTGRGNCAEAFGCFNLLVTPHEGLSDDRALDTNTLVVIVLRFASSRRVGLKITEPEPKAYLLDRVDQIVRLMQDIIQKPESPWRMRWKSIYLLADVVHILSLAVINIKENKQLEADQLKSHGRTSPDRRCLGVSANASPPIGR